MISDILKIDINEVRLVFSSELVYFYNIYTP